MSFPSPKLSLCSLPTPLENLANLGRELDLELYIKRDDLISVAGGGNKVRKLEFLLADALESGARTLLTTGALQSNHCRQTALLGAKLNLKVHLVLMGDPPDSFQGNLFLDKLAGAQIHFTGKGKEESLSYMEILYEELKRKNSNPYLIPYGGSNEVGVQGYISAWQELEEQAKEKEIGFDFVILPVSSGGTMAGILLGQALTGFQTISVGISVGPAKNELEKSIADLLKRTSLKLRADIVPPDFRLYEEFVGPGYGILD
ncbi:MAG: 1-aminocyclopropane-1-carboxylate deaminase/D-cysteine desulfhydrase, partial [bacterium]